MKNRRFNRLADDSATAGGGGGGGVRNAPLYILIAVFAVVLVLAVILPVVIFANNTAPTTTSTSTAAPTSATTTTITAVPTSPTTTTTTITAIPTSPTTTTTITAIPTSPTTTTTITAITTVPTTTTTTTAAATTTTGTTTTAAVTLVPTTIIPTTVTTTAAPAPPYNPQINSFRTIGLNPYPTNPSSGCPILSLDIQGSTSDSTVYLFAEITSSDIHQIPIPAQETATFTPILNPLDICLPSMVFTNPVLISSCPTSNLYLNAARNGQITPAETWTARFKYLNTRYLLPDNITYPVIPNNTIIKQIASDLFWYLPSIYTCVVTSGGRCTSLSANASVWTPNSGPAGQYIPLGPYVLSDPLINPVVNGSYTLSADIDAVISSVTTYYASLGYLIGYAGIGAKNLTNGCIEISSPSYVLPLPPTARSDEMTKPPRKPVLKIVNRPPNFSGHPRATSIPQISYINTVGFYNYLSTSINIEDSYSPDANGDHLFAYMSLVSGTFSSGVDVDIAQQTQYYSPPWSNAQCNTDLTFNGFNVTRSIIERSSPEAILRSYAIGAIAPITYGIVSLIFVPGTGPYTIEQAVASATVPPKTLYYFMYAPRMLGVYPNGTATSSTIYWNTTTGDFAFYPISPVDPVFNPSQNLTFSSISTYFQWAALRFVSSTIVSVNMPDVLFGAIEFATVNPPVYGGTNPTPPFPPVTGGNCGNILNCRTNATSIMLADEQRCNQNQILYCLFAAGISNIIFTGKSCNCKP